MFNEKLEEMSEGKDKELLKILSESAKPYQRKADGYAHKVSEDKEITYKDHSDQELTLKVPAGSYIVVNGDSCYPEIQTAEDFEAKNKIVGREEKSDPEETEEELEKEDKTDSDSEGKPEEEKPKKKDKKQQKLGIALLG